MRKLFSQEKPFKCNFDDQRLILRDKIFDYRGTLNIETYLQAVSQKHQTVLVTLELPHFIVGLSRYHKNILRYYTSLPVVSRYHAVLC